MDRSWIGELELGAGAGARGLGIVARSWSKELELGARARSWS